MEQVTNATYKM